MVNSVLATAHAGEQSTTPVLMPPCGINPSPEWALDRAGLPREDGPAYTYPDTQVPVRLYLIDTSVANPGDWIGANPKLVLEKTKLIRGLNDPQTFSTDHGTKMLSLIGGMETGIAPGTPIHVVNYDVFPTAETTTVSLLSNAVNEAIQDARNNPVPMRSVICIGTTSAELTNSYSLQLLITQAVSSGIPVIVPAGNTGMEFPTSGNSYIPGAYGTQQGVICVGASCGVDTRISISNYGAPVDLLAPGDKVRVLTDKEETPFAAMTGTSPATALVAGAVLTELSLDPSLTPAEVEERLKTAAILPPIPAPLPVLRATVAATIAMDIAEGILIPADSPSVLGYDPTAFEGFVAEPSEDSDGDGIPDFLEAFSGADAPPPKIAPSANQEASYTFPIAEELFDVSTPFALKNGNIWRIQCSHDMNDWQTPTGSLSKATDEFGQVWLTATFPAPPNACFVRIQLLAPATTE
ncbi:MAG: S8 family serine peptidase [Verrucomicrobiota bacterium]